MYKKTHEPCIKKNRLHRFKLNESFSCRGIGKMYIDQKEIDPIR